MLRWLWRLQSDRGGQHAEAGVLMATLIVLGGAVAVGSVPQLSTAVADQWVCHISDRGSERCGGTTSPGDADGGGTFTARTFDSTTDATAAGYTDPAESHLPLEDIPASDNGETAFVDGIAVAMRECSQGKSTCVDEAGTVHECAIKTAAVGVIGILRQIECSPTITTKTDLTCTDEGLSPTTDTCAGPTSIYHCTNADAEGDRSCVDADNDADASIPDGQPVSCGRLTGDSATCMGSNGTLYQCPDINKRDNCTEGGRNISPTDPALSPPEKCDPIVSHGDTTGRVVRCTYTPTSCNPEPAEGTCADQAVSVRCLKDPPTDPNIEYQHCQSLGTVVPKGQSLQTICLDREPSGCGAAAAVTTGRVPGDLVRHQVGPLEFGIDPAATTNVSVDGERINMDAAELTDHCRRDPGDCDSLIDETLAGIDTAAADYLRAAGLCDTNCGAVLDQLRAGAGQSPSGPGRGLLDQRTKVLGTIAVGGAVIFGGGGVAALTAGAISGTTLATILGSVTVTSGVFYLAHALAGFYQGGVQPPATQAAVLQAMAEMRGWTERRLAEAPPSERVRDMIQTVLNSLPAADRGTTAAAVELAEQGMIGLAGAVGAQD